MASPNLFYDLELTLLTCSSSNYVHTDGAGLFCGVLRSFLARGAACPKVLAATHFHDVFQRDLLDPALPIAFLHMQILLPSSDGEEASALEVHNSDEEKDGEDGDEQTRSRVRKGETITYLYRFGNSCPTLNNSDEERRVASGLSLESHAAQCAQMFGLPARIVQRARYVRYAFIFFKLFASPLTHDTHLAVTFFRLTT